jgi:serine protease Do
MRSAIALRVPARERQVTLTILRDNREQKITATTGEFKPEGEKTGETETSPGATGQGKLGLSVIPLTPEIASQLNLTAGTQGVVVDTVEPAGSRRIRGFSAGRCDSRSESAAGEFRGRSERGN